MIALWRPLTLTIFSYLMEEMGDNYISKYMYLLNKMHCFVRDTLALFLVGHEAPENI